MDYGNIIMLTMLSPYPIKGFSLPSIVMCVLSTCMEFALIIIYGGEDAYYGSSASSSSLDGVCISTYIGLLGLVYTLTSDTVVINFTIASSFSFLTSS